MNVREVWRRVIQRFLNIENGKGVIYGSNQDDYTFVSNDIKESTFSGNGATVTLGNETMPSLRFIVEFNDGKRRKWT